MYPKKVEKKMKRSCVGEGVRTVDRVFWLWKMESYIVSHYIICYILFFTNLA